MNVKQLRKQLMAAIAMVVVAAVALSSATYAWFVNNTKVTAESVTVTAQAANNLLITHGNGTTDPIAWGTTATMGSFTTTNFKPVSTVGAATQNSSTKELSFFKDENWTTDSGDSGKYNASSFVAATAGTEYYKDTLTLKASQVSKLYLDTDTVFKAFDGTTNTEDTDSSNLTNKTLRLGLVVKGTGSNSYDGVYIYQIDPTQNSTGSTYNTTVSTMSANGIVKGISAADAAANITGKNVDNTNGVTKFIASETVANNALATAPASTAMVETLNAADVLYQFTGADDTVTIDVYVWMEGCDYDCNSTVVKAITEQKITATLGFCVGAAN